MDSKPTAPRTTTLKARQRVATRSTATRREVDAWSRIARRLAKMILKYDADWHGYMWDGGVMEEDEEKAWKEIVKQARVKGLHS